MDTEGTTESVRIKQLMLLKSKNLSLLEKKYQRNIRGHKLRQIKLLLPSQGRHNVA